MIKTIKIGNNTLISSDDCTIPFNMATFNNYHAFIENIVCSVLEKMQENLTITFNCNNSRTNHFPRIKSDIDIGFQFEQLITLNEHNQYEISEQTKFERYNRLNECDFIVEYSQPNIKFSSTLDDMKWYNDKAVYVPNIFNCEMSNNKLRNQNVAVVWNETPHRKKLIADQNIIIDKCVGHSMIELKNKLDNYKILLEVQQTEKTKVFGEIRCAALLSTGILIISQQDCPFLESLPYHQHIIWTSTDNIKNKIDEVLSNYDIYCEKYLRGLETTLEEMNKIAYNNIKNAIINNINKG